MDLFGTAKRMWALDSPTFTIPANLVMIGSEGEMTIPLPAYLIEHPRGLILFDTGLVPEAIDDARAVYGDMADLMGIKAKPDQRLDRQIEALGHRLSDVTHVIASHLHYDHAGGLSLFPEAKLYIGAGEMPHAYWPGRTVIPGFTDHAFHRSDFADIPRFRWREIPGRDIDLFGDGSIVILYTPGHTPGELSLLVRLPNRNFILTGDTVHVRAALELEIPSIGDMDSVAAVHSLQRMKLIRDAADATVWITHDPEDWADNVHAPHCHE